MTDTALRGILALLMLTGCAASVGERVVVKGAGPTELLKLRAGPGLGYKVVVGLPDGTVLTRRDCVTEVGQLWCRVSLAKASSVSGYVSADYLSDD
ncbi:MAG: SH3 domain-containing protein [Rhodobacteraceae bacterium]|jgi:uncharacterized protein YraI|nr:SH3 domain-containing protein [Paracoccaceae bacterium]